MSKVNKYPGDTDSKKLARVQMYKRSKQFFSITAKPKGMAITLAGPEAAEFGCMRHVLDFKPWEMLFVDRNQDYLIEALIRQGDVNVYEGEINDVLVQMLKAKDRAAFINLDFCGKLSDSRLESARLAAQLLEPRGLLYYTFFRGREQTAEREAMEMPPNDHLKASKEGRELSRCIYIVKELLKVIGNEFELIFLMRYDSVDPDDPKVHAPMGMVGFQRMPLAYRTSSWKTVLNSEMEGAVSNHFLGSEVQDGLRIAALALAHQGKRAKEIQSILNVPAGRVAAWIAVDTTRRRKESTSGESKPE